jgi:hypothetical protein
LLTKAFGGASLFFLMGNTKRNRRKSKIMRSSSNKRSLRNVGPQGSENFTDNLSSSLEFPLKPGVDDIEDPEDISNLEDQLDQPHYENQDKSQLHSLKDQNGSKVNQSGTNHEVPNHDSREVRATREAQSQSTKGGHDVKQRRQKNERFQDVENTGSWGNLSMTEIFVGAIVLIVVVACIIAVAVIFAGKKKGSDSGKESLSVISSLPTAAPSMHPEVDAAVQLPVILDALEAINVSTAGISSDFFFYEPSFTSDPSRLPRERAISWILNNDPRDPPPEDPALTIRFALADIYFSFNGESWINHDYWLSGENACTWYGVFCDPTHSFIHELDLSRNNVSGTISPTFALLSELRSLVLSNNYIYGTIPSENLGNMPDLSILYLNDNRLSALGTYRSEMLNIIIEA